MKHASVFFSNCAYLGVFGGPIYIRYDIFNIKHGYRGIDVLKKKSELHQEMARRREQQHKKEQKKEMKEKRTSFEQKLEEQANKLKLVKADCQSLSFWSLVRLLLYQQKCLLLS